MMSDAHWAGELARQVVVSPDSVRKGAAPKKKLASLLV